MLGPNLLRMASRSAKTSQVGMTFLEFLIASLMLATFTGVVVMVMELSLSFLGDTDLTDQEMKNPDANANGVLIDHAEAQLSIDKLIEVLSQPGISKDVLKSVSKGDKRCSESPVSEWNLPMPAVYRPSRYEFCLGIPRLEGVEIEESELDVFIKYADDPLNPPPQFGIYIVQALPKDKVDASRLPVRRLFCRPRPFC